MVVEAALSSETSVNWATRDHIAQDSNTVTCSGCFSGLIRRVLGQMIVFTDSYTQHSILQVIQRSL
jgi:hypothetical protein